MRTSESWSPCEAAHPVRQYRRHDDAEAGGEGRTHQLGVACGSLVRRPAQRPAWVEPPPIVQPPLLLVVLLALHLAFSLLAQPPPLRLDRLPHCHATPVALQPLLRRLLLRSLRHARTPNAFETLLELALDLDRSFELAQDVAGGEEGERPGDGVGGVVALAEACEERGGER